MAQEKKATKISKKKYTYARGRRKEAVCTIRLYAGKGESLINGKGIKEVYASKRYLKQIFLPLDVVESVDKFHFSAIVSGGGVTGQIGAIKLALARSLAAYDEQFRPAIKKVGLLRRDPRKKERKKPGLKKARKQEQFSKR